MKKPYRIPMKSRSVDIVLSGQVFEHVPLFWASLLEIARVMRPGGYFFMTVPSRGHVHAKYDCWRIYPDGLRAMAAWSQLALREAFTDFPPPIRDAAGAPRRRHDFAAIDSRHYYWGDTVGVFEQPARSPGVRVAVLRAVVRAWANRIGDLEDVPRPAPGPEADAARRTDVLSVAGDSSVGSSRGRRRRPRSQRGIGTGSRIDSNGLWVLARSSRLGRSCGSRNSCHGGPAGSSPRAAADGAC